MPERYHKLVFQTVTETMKQCNVSKRWVLDRLSIKPSTYYRWLRTPKEVVQDKTSHPDTILPSERDAVIEYAKQNPDLRHRELAWRMIDDNVACMSASSVYKILCEANLIRRWQKEAKRIKNKPVGPKKADERWQSDISYIKIQGKKYYLITFIDEYSRFIVHHELMTSMDANAVSLAAERAFNKLKKDRLKSEAASSNRHKQPFNKEKTFIMPIIQTDNGSCYISYEFKRTLSEHKIGHFRIHPHCPEENGLIERSNRTIKEVIEEYEFTGLIQARTVIAEIIHYYNHVRLHSSIGFLRPADYYRGNPAKLLEERSIKLQQARHNRREENLNIRQKSLPLPDPFTVENHNLFQRAICLTES